MMKRSGAIFLVKCFLQSFKRKDAIALVKQYCQNAIDLVEVNTILFEYKISVFT